MDAKAHVRAVGEGQVAPRLSRAVEIEAIGVGEHRRIAVGGADRDANEVTARDLRAAEPGIGGGVPVDDRRRRLEP